MAAINFEKLLEEAEKFVRQGQGGRAIELLAKIPPAKIPRIYKLPLADICRRSGALHLGLRILDFVVDPDSTEEKAKSKEIAGYAVLLQKIGSLSEALKLLKTADPEEAPEVFLYRAFCHFNRWDYEAALPLLKSYRELITSPYAKLIASVNIASALVSTGRWSEALHQLNENLENCESLGAHRLAGNSLEMRAQYHLQQGNLDGAALDLKTARQKIGDEKTSDQLFILKWEAVVCAHREKSTAALLEFRREAVARQHWESVRDTDFHILKIAFDENLFDRLYFGTPFEAYRARLGRELRYVPQKQKVNFGSSGGTSFDLQSGKSNPAGLVTSGDKIHKVLEILWSDFYQPAKLGTLFAALFPDEHFNAWSSPNRVHQLLRRTRRKLEEGGFPVTITENDGTYQIAAEANFELIVSREHQAVSRDEAHIAKLRVAMGTSNFSVSDAQETLQVSKATAQRLLRRGVDSGVLGMAGNGPATKYYLAA